MCPLLWWLLSVIANMLPPVTRKCALSPGLFFESLGKREADLAQALYHGIRIIVHPWMRHVVSSDSLRFNHAETGRSRNYSGKLEPRPGQQRAELGLGALTTAGTYQHVDIVGGGTTRHVRLI